MSEWTRLCVTYWVTSDPLASPPAPGHLAASRVPLVTHLVNETMARVPSAVDRNDLRAPGLHALLAAAHDLGTAPGRSFVEHATITVRGALVDELRAIDWAARAVRPRSPEAAATRLAAALEPFPDPAAAADALGLSLDRTGEGTQEAAAPLRARARDEHGERVECVSLAVQQLPERQRHVVRGYFLDQRPMADLAAEVGASEARAVRLRSDALALLRDAVAAAFGPEPSVAVDPPDNDTRRRRAYARAVATQCAAQRSLAGRSRQRMSA